MTCSFQSIVSINLCAEFSVYIMNKIYKKFIYIYFIGTVHPKMNNLYRFGTSLMMTELSFWVNWPF